MREATRPSTSSATELGKIVTHGLRTLDLTAKQYEKATAEYECIAAHISSKVWFCKKYAPDIYPQGSMALGTCIRPFGKEEFDLDMVLAVLPLPGLSYQDLLSDLLHALSDLKGNFTKIERMECCLRFHYPGDFHLDLVPAIKDANGLNPDAIQLASKSGNGNTPSDPKAFVAEFEEVKKRRLPQALSAEGKIANSSRSITVDPAPERTTERNKFTLQTVVQLLKRHCVLYFQDRKDRPSSAVITALCADCYLGHQDLYEATEHALIHLHGGISAVEPRVPNPRYMCEDFADRWSQTPPNREAAFHEWLAQARTDFAQLGQFRLREANTMLDPWLGKEATTKAIENFDNGGVSAGRRSGTSRYAPGLGLVATSSKAKAAVPTSFCGNSPE